MAPLLALVGDSISQAQVTDVQSQAGKIQS